MRTGGTATRLRVLVATAVVALGALGLVGACADDGARDSGRDGSGAVGGSGVADTVDESQGRSAVVARVVDGDTIVVDDGERVRLIGIDTPESVKPDSPVECFGREASRRLSALLPAGTVVELVADVEPIDRYDRTLSYVYLPDGRFVNALLVSEGFALAYTVPPNVAHADELARLQGEAQSAGRGLWSACPVE